MKTLPKMKSGSEGLECHLDCWDNGDGTSIISKLEET